MYLHGFVRIHVDGLHDPARAISADGDHRQVKTAEAFANFFEDRTIARVAGEINRPLRAAQHPATPVRAVPVKRCARGEMLRRHAEDFLSIRQRSRLPPCKFPTMRNSASLKPRRQSAGQPVVRNIAQSLYGRCIQMIVVTMADEHIVDFRQCRERHTGRRRPPEFIGEWQRLTVAKNRIRQNISPAMLNEKRGVPDPSQLNLFWIRLRQITRRTRFRLIGWQLTRRNQGWLHGPAAKLPAQDIQQAVRRVRLEIGKSFSKFHGILFSSRPLNQRKTAGRF